MKNLQLVKIELLQHFTSKSVYSSYRNFFLDLTRGRLLETYAKQSYKSFKGYGKSDKNLKLMTI